MDQKYNTRNPAVKRLMREACELVEATEEYCARPLDDNLFEWHFTVHGSPGTEYEGGVYHGRILLPSEYPMKPPNIILLTPNGRFETNKKICLSISGHHPETWQPSWSIRTALLALIAFMSSPGNGAIGSLDYTPEERKILAEKSQKWMCNECGRISDLLSKSNSKPMTVEETNIISQIALKAEEVTGKRDVSEDEGVLDVENENTPELSEERVVNEDQTDGYAQDISNVNSVDDFWNIVVWGLVAAIALLLARRMFFFY